MHVVITTEGLSEAAIEVWPRWDFLGGLLDDFTYKISFKYYTVNFLSKSKFICFDQES